MHDFCLGALQWILSEHYFFVTWNWLRENEASPLNCFLADIIAGSCKLPSFILEKQTSRQKHSDLSGNYVTNIQFQHVGHIKMTI